MERGAGILKNILVITGSPRINGNSDLLADAFIKGAKSQGHTVTKFEAAKKTISGCRACGRCWSQGNACILRDAFSELEPLVESADVLVLVSPLYWFSLSAQIKAVIDRLNAYDAPNCPRPLKIKESLLLTCAAGSDEFDGLVNTFKHISKYLRCNITGILTVPNVKEKGDIQKTDALLQAELLGVKL